MLKLQLAILALFLFGTFSIPLAEAQVIAPADTESPISVDIRLKTALQYPNDRDMMIEVAALAFKDDKPLNDRVMVKARLINPHGGGFNNASIIFEITISVQPGQADLISFGHIEEVGTYEVEASATLGNSSSRLERQTTRITYAPQVYHAGFTDGGRFLVSPTCHSSPGGCNLSVYEFVDDGFGIQAGRSWVLGNESIEIIAPEGYMAVRYSVVDEWGWHNYQRSFTTGITAHGSPYVWLYGDLSRIEPIAQFYSTGSMVIGGAAGLMLLIGSLRMAGSGYASHRERIDKLPPRQREYRPSFGERHARRQWNNRDPYFDDRRYY